jgi:hypothetical protein
MSQLPAGELINTATTPHLTEHFLEHTKPKTNDEKWVEQVYKMLPRMLAGK